MTKEVSPEVGAYASRAASGATFSNNNVTMASASSMPTGNSRRTSWPTPHAFCAIQRLPRNRAPSNGHNGLAPRAFPTNILRALA
jgi:hypothetical protein